ncbi:MAG: hypothetical protein DRO00_01300 [Thermoproteota archaeon]|nr:MAG: hypothetical protein DRO00_01300 [Candidatus Korarchaeota archaeon]
MNPKSRRLFIALSIAGFFAILSSTMSKSPTLPLFAESLGIHTAEIGFIASISTFVGIFTNVIAGSLSDKYGRKALLRAGGFVFATAPLFYLFVRNSFQLAAIRAYHGLATATFVPVSLAFIADIFPNRKGEMMGLFSSAMTAGRMIAPLLAGTIILRFGFKEAYETCWLAGMIAFPIILLIKAPTSSQMSGFRPFRLIGGRVVIVASFEAISYFVMQAIETFLPLYASSIDISASEVGILFTIQILTMALLKPIAGRVSDRIGRVPPIIVGMIVISMSVIGLSFSRGFYLMMFSLVLLSAGVAFVFSSTKPLASEIMGSKMHGTAIGTTETVKDIGQAFGPVIVGILIRSIGFSSAFLSLAALPLLFALFFVIIRKRLIA